MTNELEKILDIFQNIRDREVVRRQNPPIIHHNRNNNQARGLTTGHGGMRINNNSRDEGWMCLSCKLRILREERYVTGAIKQEVNN